MDRIKVERAIDGLTEWQKHVQTNSDIDRDISTAIDALKAQLSSEDATSDTISRQAALDIFDDYNISVENGELEAYSRDRKRLCELPTVQPVATDTNVGDTISRQWLMECVNEGWIKFDTEKDENRFIHLVRDIAPSAQPEPQEGHWINGKCDLCGEHAPFWAMASTYHESNYCPCCGAKMKGVTT